MSAQPAGQVSPQAPREERVVRWPVRALRIAITAPVIVYQRLISPAIPRRCKYEPTCSRYAIEAIGDFGILKGAVLATWRLLRCNPWSYGGYDPVQAQRVFTAGHRDCA